MRGIDLAPRRRYTILTCVEMTHLDKKASEDFKTSKAKIGYTVMSFPYEMNGIPGKRDLSY